jgi:RNA polymerase sigma-70 factor (ECF subfamily)
MTETPSAAIPGPRPTTAEGDFDRVFTALFSTQFHRLFRYLDRLGGDPDLAADLAQEAFVRLYKRGAVPDVPEAWLATVALNLFRNSRGTLGRRLLRLTPQRAARAHSDETAAPSSAVESSESTRRVRLALDALSERDRSLLLLRAEGYSYAELASILEVAPASVGTLLARAREALRRGLSDGT